MGYLLALDLDGTLLKNDKTISERTLRALRQFREKGNKLLITTGRAVNGVKNYISVLGMEVEGNYAICANGAITLDLYTGKAVDRCMLEQNDIQFLRQWAVKTGANLQFLSDDILYTMRYNEYPAIEARHNGLEMVQLADGFLPKSAPIYKVMCIDLAENIARLRPLVPVYIKERFQYIENSPFYLEFLHPNAGKVRGIQKVMDLLCVEQSDVIAFGDAGNDIDMIRFAGLGIAMGNASDDLKAVADFITATNEEDGVAKFLENFVF